MSRSLAPFQSSVNPSQILKGGRAAACWRQDLSRLTARLTGFQKEGDWCEPIVRSHPCLCDKPLLGDSLRAVLEQRAPACAASEEPRARARVKQSESSCGVPQHKKNNDSQSSSNRQAHCSAQQQRDDKPEKEPAAIPSDVPRRADRPLLCRLAGESDAFKAEERSQPGLIEPQRHCDDPKPAPVERDRPERALLDCVSRRAVRTLHQFKAPPRHDAAEFPVRRETTETEQAFADQCSMSLKGPRVSAEVLTLLAALTPEGQGPLAAKNSVPPPDPDNERKPSRSSERRQAPEPVSDGSSNKPPIGLTGGRTRANRQLKMALNESTSEVTKDTERVPGIRDTRQRSEPPLAVSPELPLAVDRQGDSLTLPQIAPPALTAKLPPLKPPSAAGSPMLPVAAASARISAKQTEDAAHAEDLSVLAAQISRILNEEARRHGIDV